LSRSFLTRSKRRAWPGSDRARGQRLRPFLRQTTSPCCRPVVLCAEPYRWSPNYPLAVCTVGATCATPGQFDVIFEEDYDGTGVVRWVRYQLVGQR